MTAFADAAARLSGVAAAFGWTPDTFWRATPAELAAVLAALSPASEPAADAALLGRLQEQYPDG